MATAVVLGAGAVGARAARQLVGYDGIDHVLIVDAAAVRAEAAAQSLGAGAQAAGWAEALAARPAVAILAAPGNQGAWTDEVLAAGASVVSTAGSAATVGALLDRDGAACEKGRTVIVGAGFAPGLSCLLARHAADGLDAIDEVHVAKFGTGGPACARELDDVIAAGRGLDWRDGDWASPAPGRGGLLSWFPQPIGGRDCFPAAMGDAMLLVPAFAAVQRVTARVAVSRRDRVLRRMPAWRRPAAEGLLGAIRVEVRGRRGPQSDSVVLGALDRPALAAGIVAGLTAAWVATGRIATPGAAGLAVLVPDPLPLLQELARRGVRAATFEGVAAGRFA